MYDSLTTTYTFSCPVHGETHVVLSRFRRLEELPGPHHPRCIGSSSRAAAATTIRDWSRTGSSMGAARAPGRDDYVD